MRPPPGPVYPGSLRVSSGLPPRLGQASLPNAICSPMKLGLGQSARMEQRLIQSPQMIQAMQILQLSSLDLTGRIEQELMENPFLERDEGAGEESEGEAAPRAERGETTEVVDPVRDTIADEFERLRARDDQPIPRRVDREGADRKAEAMANTPDRPRSLASALLQEIALIDFSDRQRELAEFLIYSLDSRGYLTDPLPELADRFELDPGQVPAIETTEQQPAGQAGDPSEPDSPEPGSALALDETDPRPPSESEPSAASEGAPLEPAPDPRVAELEHVIGRIRQATHPGLFAGDLRECLLLQLESSGVEDLLVYRLVDAHLEDITKNRLPHIARATESDIEEIKNAIDALRELDPSPGREYGDEMAATLTPDLVVEEISGDIHVRLAREDSFGLQVSPRTSLLLADLDRAAEQAKQDKSAGEGELDGGTPEANEPHVNGIPAPPEVEQPTAAEDEEHLDDAEVAKRWARRKLEAARWLIDAVAQRRGTMLRIAGAVFRHQRAFIEEGPKGLLPLRMQEIADETHVHISTVSRAVAGKYVQTPRGIFPLKYFFTSGTTDSSGEAQSQVSIQQRLAELIESEDKKKPLSDDQLAAELAKRDGIKIARRTVTKYRKALGAPSSTQRREF